MGKRQILLTLLLGAASLTASADDWHLVINGRDNQTQVVDMSIIDRIEIRNGQIKLTQTDGQTLSFPKACFSLAGMTKQDPTAINGTPAGTASPLRVRVTGYTLQVEGVPSGSPVYIFDMSGKTVAETKGGTDGTATLHVQAFSKGTYAIRCGRQILKFLKK